MKILSTKRYSVNLLRKHKDKVFVFGDNLIRKGKGGQAIIRDEPNAIGIPTKKLPSMSNDAFFSDKEFSKNKIAIDNAINKIPKNKILVVPKDGLGTGRAKLKQKAPQTYFYLIEKLRELKK